MPAGTIVLLTELTISFGPRPAKGFQAQMPVGLRPGSCLPVGAFAAPLGAASPSPSAPSATASGRDVRSPLFERPRRLRAERACVQVAEQGMTVAGRRQPWRVLHTGRWCRHAASL